MKTETQDKIKVNQGTRNYDPPTYSDGERPPTCKTRQIVSSLRSEGKTEGTISIDESMPSVSELAVTEEENNIDNAICKPHQFVDDDDKENLPIGSNSGEDSLETSFEEDRLYEEYVNRLWEHCVSLRREGDIWKRRVAKLKDITDSHGIPVAEELAEYYKHREARS